MLFGPKALVVIGGLIAFALSAALGANDVANSLGTSVGTGAISIRQALAVGAAMEFAGAVLLGSTVTRTISTGVITVGAAVPSSVFLLGMCSVLVGCTGWMVLATRMALPVSSTHSVVGALVGLGLVSGWGVNGAALKSIGLCWILSPLSGGLVSTLLYLCIKGFVLDADNPGRATRRFLPVLSGVASFLLALFFFAKRPAAARLGGVQMLLVCAAISLLSAAFALILATTMRAPRTSSKAAEPSAGASLSGGGARRIVTNRWRDDDNMPREPTLDENAEQVFKVLQVLTACLVAFSHGSNDVSNAIGPFAAMHDFYRNGHLSQNVSTPSWVLLMGGAGISSGLWLFGKPVMETVGKRITKLVPTKGFCVELGTAMTVLAASQLGLPLSTTHTLIGGIVALGLASGDVNAINVKLLRNIALSWFVTLPASAAMATLFFKLMSPLVVV